MFPVYEEAPTSLGDIIYVYTTYMLRMDRVKPRITINGTHGECGRETFKCAGVTGEQNEEG